MKDVERLLRASMVDMTVEDAGSADARWCVDQYFAELNTRFDTGFDPSRTRSSDVREFTPPAGLILIARLHGRAVGCGALRFHLRSLRSLAADFLSGAQRERFDRLTDEDDPSSLLWRKDVELTCLNTLLLGKR